MTLARRSPVLVALAAAAVALLAWTGTAAGGGFSTTTLDPLAGQPRTGESLPVGYTIKQHGVTPVRVDGTGIAIVAPDGGRTVFPGRPQGPLGHYVADVRFPAPGAWSWEQVQGGYTMQELGRVEVAAADGPTDPAPAESADDAGGPGASAWALLGATVAAAALLAGVALRPGRTPAG
jgi:hypothetical protein